MSLRPPEEVVCRTCAGSGKVTLPAEIDTLDVYFFGCWREAGHFLRWIGHDGIYEGEILKRMPPTLGTRGHFDSVYCPGYMAKDAYRRSVPEVEGHAKLTHIAGWTILGWWDRSVDNRGGCNSNIIVPGTHTFTIMLEIGERRIPHLMKRQRQPIVLTDTADESPSVSKIEGGGT